MGAISKDGRIGFADVYYPVKAEEVEKSSADALVASTEPATKAGMQVEYGGGVVTNDSESSAEKIGLMVGFLVLAITLGSMMAAGLPLITAVIGVMLGTTGLTALSGAIEISETAPILASMLGLAVGIDYALFILSRHRQNLLDGMEPGESAAQATATAGSAVVFAGATVVIALTGLARREHPVPDGDGPCRGGHSVARGDDRRDPAPRHHGFAGNRLGRMNRFLVKRPRRRAEGKPTFSERYGRLVTRRPLAVAVLTVGLLGAIAIPATHMKLGLPDDGPARRRAPSVARTTS